MIGVDPGLDGLLVELVGAVHVAVVGHPDRRHPEPGASASMCLIRAAPSSIEYSVWTSDAQTSLAKNRRYP